MIEKKHEIIILLLTVIVLGIIIGICSNILFDSFYSSYSKATTIISFILLIIISIFIFFLIVKKQNTVSKNIVFVFPLDRIQKKIYDLPSHPPSVHCRVNFNKLTATEKLEVITDYNDNFIFRDGDGKNSFINESLLEMIVTLIVLFPSYEFEDHDFFVEYTANNFPDFFKNNRFFLDWIKHVKVFLPKGTKIDYFLFDVYNTLIVKNSYISIYICWIVRANKSIHYSKYFFSTVTDSKSNECNELFAKIKVTFEYNILKIFSKHTNLINDWASTLLSNLDKIDWNNSKTDMILHLLSNIQNSLHNKKA